MDVPTELLHQKLLVSVDEDVFYLTQPCLSDKGILWIWLLTLFGQHTCKFYIHELFKADLKFCGCFWKLFT